MFLVQPGPAGPLHGIVNGVDYGDWDPSIDPLIPHRFSPSDLSGKLANKRELLEQFELEFSYRFGSGR